MKWTEAQQAAITARGGRILVSAAAGSGKTAVLVERVKELMTDRENPISADRFLIATFSRAAASEMRVRTEEALGKLFAESPQDLFLKRQRMLFHRSHISTIHAFCMRLIRDHFEALNLSPDFSLLDESQEKLLTKEVSEALLLEFYESEDETFLTLVEFLSSGRDDVEIIKMLNKFYKFLHGIPFFEHWLSESITSYQKSVPVEDTVWGKEIFSHTVEVVQNLEKRLAMALSEMEGDEALEKAYAPHYAAALSGVNAVLEALLRKSSWDTVRDAIKTFSFPRLGSLRKYEDEMKKARLRAVQTEVKDTFSELSGSIWASSSADFLEDCAMLAHMFEMLSKLVLRYHALLLEKKRARNVLSFADLEYFALHLLGEMREDGTVQKTSLAETIANQYDAILVDEYQDTNEVQDLIFTLVSKNEENLFLVGDVKQSIYGFRGAEPSLFQRKRESSSSYESGEFPLRILLGHNFRSRAGVCAGINCLFDGLMTKRLGGVSYKEGEALVPGARFEGEVLNPVELVFVDYDGENGETVAEQEARLVARKIAEMVGSGEHVQDKKTGMLRPCKFSDFAVLFRSKRNMELFEKALHAAGVPAWSDYSKEFFQSKEILYLISALAVIDNPLSDVDLVATMMSPLFDFTADDLARIKVYYGQKSMFLAVKEAAEQGDEKSAHFLNVLTELRTFAVTAGVDAVLEKLLEVTSFDLYLWGYESADNRLQNVRYLITQAQAFENAGFFGLSAFNRQMRLLLEDKTELKRDGALPEGENVVQIMTIHRSKGLEFPICFVVDTAKRFNFTDTYQKMQFHTELGIATKMRKIKTLHEYSTVPLEAIKLRKKEELLSEELRIFYVALTRAKERLFIVGTPKDLDKEFVGAVGKLSGTREITPLIASGARSYSDWIFLTLAATTSGNLFRERLGLPQMSGEDSLLTPVIWTASGEEITLSVQMKEQAPAIADERLVETLSSKIDYVYPYTNKSAESSKFSVSELVADGQAELPPLSRPRFMQGEGLTGAEKGNVYHAVMEFSRFSALKADTSTELLRLRQAGFLTEEELAVVVPKKLQTFLRSPLFARVEQAQEVYREFPFLVALHPEDKESPMLQGISDLVFVEDGEVVILDYKTDYVQDAGVLHRKYERQVALYAGAIAETLGLPVKEAFLYSFHLDTDIPIKLT